MEVQQYVIHMTQVQGIWKNVIQKQSKENMQVKKLSKSYKKVIKVIKKL